MSGKVAPIVLSGAKSLGIELSPDAAATFEAYYALLEHKGGSVNLTAIKGATDVANLHFLDSIALLKAARFSNARVIDIGSGAGFPGIPIKIAEPSVSLTALDSAKKRVAFLSGLCDELEIKAEFIQARAEDAAHYPEIRESYDIALSRAVARLNILCEMCLPFVAVGGVFIAMKGADPAGEISEAGAAIETLGAQLYGVYNYEIPGTGIAHSAVLIKKTHAAPGKYPRRYARMLNSPL